jgi:hypothetical protein
MRPHDPAKQALAYGLSRRVVRLLLLEPAKQAFSYDFSRRPV